MIDGKMSSFLGIIQRQVMGNSSNRGDDDTVGRQGQKRPTCGSILSTRENRSLLREFFRRKDKGNPIVPERPVSSQTLMIVVAIMSFLTCLTYAAVTMVWEQASNWQNEISSEVTIQIRPIDGIDINQEIAKARNLATNTPGIADVVLLDDAWSAQLLEPWLGQDFDLKELPVPRLIVLELDLERPANLSALAERIEANVQGASFDDHRLWLDRLSSLANTTVLVGVGLMILMLTSMVLSVTFATHSAMSSNNEIVEVLHFIGGRDAFIANEFQRRFLSLGLKGGCTGGLGAILCFLVLNFWSRFSVNSTQNEQLQALFGRFEIGLEGYVGTIFLIIIVGTLTAATSRIAVFRYLTRVS